MKLWFPLKEFYRLIVVEEDGKIERFQKCGIIRRIEKREESLEDFFPPLLRE